MSRKRKQKEKEKTWNVKCIRSIRLDLSRISSVFLLQSKWVCSGSMIEGYKWKITNERMLWINLLSTYVLGKVSCLRVLKYDTPTICDDIVSGCLFILISRTTQSVPTVLSLGRNAFLQEFFGCIPKRLKYLFVVCYIQNRKYAFLHSSNFKTTGAKQHTRVCLRCA